MDKKPLVDINNAAAAKINPQQAELNAILTTGRYILIDAKGSSLIMGMENPELILNLLSAVKNKVMVSMADSFAFDYADRLRMMVEGSCKVSLVEPEETKKEA
jgi:hypothetical protein